MCSKKEERGNDKYTASGYSRKIFHCPICSHSTNNRQNMNIHTYQHTNERPYQCEVCGQTFKGPSNLHAHKRQHSSEMKYNCPICSKAFRDRGTFKQHMRRHLGDKRHVCEHCGKSFVISTDLKKHIRVHTGEKPYQCNICGKSFSDGSGMVRHQKMHTPKSRFECSACSKMFARKDLCNYHIKKVHGALGPVRVREINISDDIGKPDDSTTQGQMKESDKKSKTKKTFPPKKTWQSFERLTEEATKRLQDHAIQNYSQTEHLGDYQHQQSVTNQAQNFQSLPSTVLETYNHPPNYYQEPNQSLPLYPQEPIQNL